MPTYEIEIPGQGKFRIDSDTELTEEDAISAATEQGLMAQQPKEFSQMEKLVVGEPVEGERERGGFLSRTGRRVSEAAEAFTRIPESAAGVFTGGKEGRIWEALRLLQGIGAPASTVLAPVGAGVETIASAVLPEPAAELVGHVGEIAGSFGIGALAAGGKLGKVGTAINAIAGTGRPKTLVEELKHDPQLRYVVKKEAEQLALEAGSPALAEASLAGKAADNKVWLEWAKQNQIIDEVPQPPRFSVSEAMEFQVPTRGDLGWFATLGTPATRAAGVNPRAAEAFYELNLAEMRVSSGIQRRDLSDAKALAGIGDKDLRAAVAARALDQDTTKITNPNVRRVVEYVEGKMRADRDALMPKFEAAALERFERQAIRKLTELGESTEPARVKEIARQTLAKLHPERMTMDDIMVQIFPGFHKIVDEAGHVWGHARSKQEVLARIQDLVIQNPLLKGKLSTTSKAFFDSDLLRFFQGRLSRAYKQIAEATAPTKAEIRAAEAGDLSSVRRFRLLAPMIEKGRASGYRQDLQSLLNVYNRTIERWSEISDVQKRVQPLIRELENRGYNNFASAIGDKLSDLWGFRIPGSELIDATVAATPVLNQVVAPHALERWLGVFKTGVVTAMLKFNPRFHAVNSTQIAQTLWPITDGSSIAQGFKLRGSDAGKAILTKHGLTDPLGKVESFVKGLGPAERMNQQVAFLTMYNKARKLGLSDLSAGEYGKLRGNLYSQFMGLTTDVPIAFRKLDPWGVMTMFQRFPVKQMEQVLDLVKDRNFPGAAKWLAVNLALGGFKAATLGTSGWLTKRLYDQIKTEYGEHVADVFHVGLPGLAGIDLSNSVMLYNPPFGESWQERLGNMLAGPIGSVASSVYGAATATSAVEPNAAKRVLQAFIDRLPLAKELDAIRRLIEGDYELRDPMGRLRYKAEVKDLVKRMLGARTTREAYDDTFASALLEMRAKRDEVLDYAASRHGQALITGVDLGESLLNAVKKEVDNWNTMWPEFPISGSDIATRAQRRQEAAVTNLRDRLLKQAPAVLRESGAFTATPEESPPPATQPPYQFPTGGG